MPFALARIADQNTALTSKEVGRDFTFPPHPELDYIRIPVCLRGSLELLCAALFSKFCLEFCKSVIVGKRSGSCLILYFRSVVA